MLTIEIGICFFLFLNNVAYKKNDLWNNPKVFLEIHFTDFMPLKSISTTTDSNGNTNFNIQKSSGFYSIVEIDKYRKQCSNNYYIENNGECPINDIIIEKKKANDYDGYTELKVNDNLYFYYTNNKENGRLYKELLMTEIPCVDENYHLKNGNNCYNIEFISDFDYTNLENIKKEEEEKKNNPFLKLKNYSRYSDFICFSLLIFALIYILNEPYINKKFNSYKILGYICILISTILFIIRYSLFTKIKKYYNDNKDLYQSQTFLNDENYYFPKKFFNLDSILPSTSIISIIFIILYIFVPHNNHVYCKEIENLPPFTYPLQEDEGGAQKRKNRIYLFLFPFYIIYFIVFILDILNDNKIKKKYDIFDTELKFNWKMNPLKSTITNSLYEYQFGKKGSWYYTSWKSNENFPIYKSYSYNYLNVFNSKNKKVCGKDSQNNDLYFPEEEECPINDIYISTQNITMEDYNKIMLNSGSLYLYYTNKNTEGKILIDLKISGTDGLQLNYDKSNTLCNYLDQVLNKGDCLYYSEFNTIPFYSKIDKSDACELISCYSIDYSFLEIDLYALYYQGINSLKIDSRIDIEKYDNKLKTYKRILTAKYVFGFFTMVSLFYFNIILCVGQQNFWIKFFAISLLMFLLIHTILCFVAMIMNIKYVKNFLNVINADFENKYMNESLWIILLFIIDIILLILDIYITVYTQGDQSETENDGINPEIINVERAFNNDSRNSNQQQSLQNYPQISGEQQGLKKEKDENKGKDEYQTPKEKEENKNEIEKNSEKEKNKEKEKKEDDDDDKNCVICYEKVPEVVFGPCGHKCICESCYDKNKNSLKNCPICRKNIDAVIRRVYSV